MDVQFLRFSTAGAAEWNARFGSAAARERITSRDRAHLEEFLQSLTKRGQVERVGDSTLTTLDNEQLRGTFELGNSTAELSETAGNLLGVLAVTPNLLPDGTIRMKVIRNCL